jgi:hypothetical protein
MLRWCSVHRAAIYLTIDSSQETLQDDNRYAYERDTMVNRFASGVFDHLFDSVPAALRVHIDVRAVAGPDLHDYEHCLLLIS